MSTHKKASDLKSGDTTKWYTILSVTKDKGKVIAVVKHNDGGLGERVWDNPDTLVPIKVS